MFSPECKRYAVAGCGGFVCLWILIIIITILACIRSLGPEDQIIVYGPKGKYTIDGPKDLLVHPFRKRETRKAIRISTREYLVVKNTYTGEIRHETNRVHDDGVIGKDVPAGNALFFLGAWDELVKRENTITLSQNQYRRMIDELTGTERIVRGPAEFMPNPMETCEKGTEVGIVVNPGRTVITLNKTRGVRILHEKHGLFIPEPYEDIIEIRKPIVVKPTSYARVLDLRTGQIKHVSGGGEEPLNLDAYEQLLKVEDKIVLQKKQYVRMVNMQTGVEKIYKGPQNLMPDPMEESKTPQLVHQAIDIGPSSAVLAMKRTTGDERLVTAVGLWFPEEYEDVLEYRTATQIRPEEYAVVKSTLTGEKQHVIGPKRFLLGTYQEFLGIEKKLVLQRDEYVRLVDNQTGTEEVVKGPKTFVPKPNQKTPDGIQKCYYIDKNISLIILDRTTGNKYLNTTWGVFVPQPYERVIETRLRQSVLDHEAMVIRNKSGMLEVKSGLDSASSGGSPAFFLDAYEEIVPITWSRYDDAHKDGKSLVQATLKEISLRKQTSKFQYEIRTKDNVKLTINGAIYWRVTDVYLMVTQTPDAEADVWLKARSAMMEECGKYTLGQFSQELANITSQAFEKCSTDPFFAARGVVVEELEVTSWECVDSGTAEILQEIIDGATDRTNRLAVQESANNVRLQEIQADIQLENQETELINNQRANLLLEAEVQGVAAGEKELQRVRKYLDELSNAVSTVGDRVALLKMREKNQGRSQDITNIQSGNIKLFMTPKTGMDIRLDMAAGKDLAHDDRRLHSVQPANSRLDEL